MQEGETVMAFWSADKEFYEAVIINISDDKNELLKEKRALETSLRKKNKSSQKQQVPKKPTAKDKEKAKKEGIKKHRPLSAKNIVCVPSSESDNSADDLTDVEEDSDMFLEKITARARKSKKAKKSVPKRKPSQIKPQDTPKENNEENYREKYMELQLQMQLQEKLQNENAREKTKAMENERKERERREWEEQEKKREKEKKQRLEGQKQTEEQERTRHERERQFQEWQTQEKRRAEERKKSEKEEQQKNRQERERRFQEWEKQEKRRVEERERAKKEKQEREEQEAHKQERERQFLEWQEQEKRQAKERKRREKEQRLSLPSVTNHQEDGGRGDEEETEDDDPDWLTKLSEMQEKCAGCCFLAQQVLKIQTELEKELARKQYKGKKIEAGKTSKEDEQELMHKEKITKEDCIKAIMTTSKWGQSIRELMDLLFTSHELSTCSVRGKKTQRPALPKKRWHLLSMVIMEKFKEIRETQIVSIANVKLQEHRHL
ncbi:hypothetical protein ABFA07_008501 [Porites harrisoni]